MYDITFKIGDRVRPLQPTLKKGKETKTPAFIITTIKITEEGVYYFTNANNILYTADQLETTNLTYERSNKLPHVAGTDEPKRSASKSSDRKMAD